MRPEVFRVPLHPTGCFGTGSLSRVLGYGRNHGGTG